MSFPKMVLAAVTIQMLPVLDLNSEQFLMMNQYLELVIVTMKEGKVTTLEELNDAVVEKLLDLDNPPFFD